MVRIDTYSDMIGYVFSEGRASATSKLNELSGHSAARRILLDFQTSAATNLGAPGCFGPGRASCYVSGGEPTGSQTLVPALSATSEGELQECACSSVAVLHWHRLERHLAHSYESLSEWEDHPRRQTTRHCYK